MNNEKELIKEILDYSNKNKSHNKHMIKSSSIKKITLLNDSLNNQEEKKQNEVNRKNCNTKNELLSEKALIQKYSDNIKNSIESKTKPNALKKNNKVIFQRSATPLTSSYQSDKVKKRYGYKYQYDYLNHKYDKYNMQELAYQIEKEYSKVNSNNITFNERLKFYVAKQRIKEDKINELVDLTKPHIEEKKKIATFNRLIQDANRRIEVKQSLSNINSDTLLMNAIQCNQKTRSSSVKISHEEWTKIYQDRFMSKLIDKNEKIKMKQNAIEQKKKEEEENIEEEILKRKKVVSKEEIDAIALRLHCQDYRLLYKRNNKDNSICNQTSPVLGNRKSSSKKYLVNKQAYNNNNPSLQMGNNNTNSNHILIENYNLNNQTNYQTPVDKMDGNMILFNKAETIINDFFIK